VWPRNRRPLSVDASFGSDIRAWRRSMADLIALGADILCEGHYGVFTGQTAVRDFIEEQLAEHAG
jgi:glyoxylase-like metal-dependent hydrolase (beta-lactamase superfamily II)